MILEYLASHPLDIVSSSSDAESLLWIKELGLEGEFPPESARRSFFLGYALHPTHWIMAGVFRGEHEKLGHVVWAYPKERFGADELKKLFERDTGGQGPRELTVN